MDHSSNGNGSENGTAPGRQPTPAKLEALLAYHEKMAEAVRITLDLLRATAVVTKRQSATSIFSQALAMEGERVARRGRPPGPAKPERGHSAAAVRERRAKTFAVLDSLSTTVPSTVGMEAGTLLRHGYIKRKGDGYVRTGKKWSPDKGRNYTEERDRAAKQSARHATAKVLAGMSTTTPTPKAKMKTKGISILLQHGYIARAGDDGYVRTDKEFTP